jgi:hypothetical protein
MQPALSTGETLWFIVKGSTEPAKGVASAFHIRSPALSIAAITPTKRTGKHHDADDRSQGLATRRAEVGCRGTGLGLAV